MDMQGFPLYAVEQDEERTVYAVVGWSPNAGSTTARPHLVKITGVSVMNAFLPDDGSVFRFTVTDPREQDPRVDYAADSRRLADLIGRMVRLADECERQMHGGLRAARRIREELDK